MENHLTSYQSVITEIKSIISSGQEAVYSASSKAMLLTYWNNYYIKFYQCFPNEQIVNACVHNLLIKTWDRLICMCVCMMI